MQPIRIQAEGHDLVIDSPRLVRIGRSPQADVVVAGTTVSPVHAELRPTETGWLLVDLNSQHGTYVAGQRIQQVPLGAQPLAVAFGLRGSGTIATISPVATPAHPQPQRSAPRQPPTGPPRQPSGQQRPSQPAQHLTPSPGSPARPLAPAPANPPQPGTTHDPSRAVTMAVEITPRQQMTGPPSGPDIIVRVDGEDTRFHHPTLVTIGRHPDNAVVCQDPIVSRYHGRIDPTPGGWTYTNTSHAGTFADGRRTNSVEIEDAETLRLGHPVAGVELTLTPVLPAHVAEERIAKRRRGKRLKLWVAAAAALVLIAGAGFAGSQLLGDDPAPSSDTLTASELDQAKLATVWIRAQSTTVDGEQEEWFGSGSILTPDGKILTNAHVAEPEAEGLSDRYGTVGLTNPEYLDIAMINSPDDPSAEPEYRARVVTSDGSLDAAVLQIYATYDGGDLPPDLDLPTVPVGDSDTLSTGDEVTVLGFPGISESRGVTITSGLVSSFVADPELGSDRAEIDTDARIAPGNSGGLAINNEGEIIGIPSSLFGQEGSPVVSGRIRSINLVKPLLD